MIVVNIIAVFLLIIIPLFKTVRNFIRWFGQLNGTDWDPEDVLDAYPSERTNFLRAHLPFEYGEILFMAIAPILGIAFIFIFQTEIKPFEVAHSPTLIVYILIGYLSYWVSRLSKRQISPLLYGLLPLGMLIGTVVYIALGLHYLSELTLLGTVIFPYFAFALYAPFPALLYNLREMVIHNHFFMTKMHGDTWYHPVKRSEFFRFIGLGPWAGRIEYYLLLIPVVLGITTLLTFLGQEPLSIIHVFTEGKGFLFSHADSILF